MTESAELSAVPFSAVAVIGLGLIGASLAGYERFGRYG